MKQHQNQQYPQQREMDRTIWRIALPCVVENLLTFAATLVIAAMIGRLTEDEITAQSIGARITGLLQAFFKGIGVGATIILGICFGANKQGRCRRLGEQMMMIVLPLSLLTVAIVLMFPMSFLKIFADREDLRQMALPYLQIAIWLVPSVAVSRIVTAAFNAQGDTKTPMVIAVAMNIVNALLGYVLIFGLGPVPGYGLQGAAWSLSLAYAAGMIMGLIALYGPNGLYQKTERDRNLFSFEFCEIKNIFASGLPASVENMMWSFAAIIMTRVLISYGTTVNSGYQLASQVEEFLAGPCFGFQIAATTLVAQCLGGEKKELAEQYHRRVSFWCVTLAIPVVLVLLLLPNFAMALLTDKENVQKVGAMYLMIAAAAFLPQALNMVDFGAIRAYGFKEFPLAATVIGMWCVRIPIAAMSAWVWHADIFFVFIGIALDQFVRYGLALFYRAKKKVFPIMGFHHKSTSVN